MTAEQPHWWVRFWAGPEPRSDPKLTLRRVFRRMGLILGLVLGVTSGIQVWGADVPLWIKLVIPLGLFGLMFGWCFGLGLLMGRFLPLATGDKRDS